MLEAGVLVPCRYRSNLKPSVVCDRVVILSKVEAALTALPRRAWTSHFDTGKFGVGLEYKSDEMSSGSTRHSSAATLKGECKTCSGKRNCWDRVRRSSDKPLNYSNMSCFCFSTACCRVKEADAASDPDSLVYP